MASVGADEPDRTRHLRATATLHFHLFSMAKIFKATMPGRTAKRDILARTKEGQRLYDPRVLTQSCQPCAQMQIALSYSELVVIETVLPQMGGTSEPLVNRIATEPAASAKGDSASKYHCSKQRSNPRRTRNRTIMHHSSWNHHYTPRELSRSTLGRNVQCAKPLGLILRCTRVHAIIFHQTAFSKTEPACARGMPQDKLRHLLSDAHQLYVACLLPEPQGAHVSHAWLVS